MTDPQVSHVEDATSREIGTVNMITCIMAAMRPDALVNQGAYIALVDQSKCDPEARSSSANSGSTSDATQAASYMTATVVSTRASNDEPMRVRVWIDDAEGGMESTIFVNVAATEPPSATNPYGAFRLDFCGKAEGMTQCMMNGFLEGRADGVDFYQQEGSGGGGGGHTTALRLVASGVTSGAGALHAVEAFDGPPQETDFGFAYDQNYFLRGDQCFARDATDAGTRFSVWRYGLYDAESGARIERNSGFPIEFTAGGVTYHGYLGYHGLSLPPEAEAALDNGASVEKVDYSGGGEPVRTSYPVTRSGGKLLRFTRRTRTLHDMDQIRFSTFIGNEAEGMFAGATPFSQYEMYWDDALGMLTVTGRMNCGPDGCHTEDFPTEERPTVALSQWALRGGLSGWSQALGGEVFIDLHDVGGPVDSSAVTVVYRQQDLVYPSGMPQLLYCLQNCPTSASLQAYFEGDPGLAPPSPFVTSTFNNWNPTPAAGLVTYGTDRDSATLRDGVDAPVVYTVEQGFESHPQFRHGVRSGRLFETLADAQCETPPGQSGSFYCDGKVSGAEVYYQWETGPNSWNQFAAVRNGSGDFLAFDPPLHVNFEVPDAAAYGQYRGSSIVLQYGGFGDLWGIPGECVSRLTNQPVSCESQDARYVPSFIIPFDQALGRASDGNGAYLVKWLDREIRFARKDPAVCSSAGLALSGGLTLPTEAGLRDPSDAASAVYIGTRPSLTSAPRVIHGDVKY